MTATYSLQGSTDPLLLEIAEYVHDYQPDNEAAFESARLCLMDGIGCALQALATPDCTKLLGPIVPGTQVPHGARVPGTSYVLDPVKAAFDIGTTVRWLDFSDTWVAGGHPSDNLGGILALADYLGRSRLAAGQPALTMREVMTAIIKAYEIQGRMADVNKFDLRGIGLDHTIHVKLATTAVATGMLGGSTQQIAAALSNAFIDGQALNTYRHLPNSGARKSWAGGNATSRGVELALRTMSGEMGYATALSAPTWGFSDVLYGGRPVTLADTLADNVIRNIQFKISYPAQRHSQTAVEGAVRLHKVAGRRIADIDKVVVHTHALAMKTIDASGPLPNFAARDHSMQYIVAVGLLHGGLTTDSYTDDFAADPRIDALRSKVTMQEDKRYTAAYEDRGTRANPSAVQVFFKDNTATERIEIHYPLGDARRRAEGVPLLQAKFDANLARRYAAKQQAAVRAMFADLKRLQHLGIHEFMGALVV